MKGNAHDYARDMLEELQCDLYGLLKALNDNRTELTKFL